MPIGVSTDGLHSRLITSLAYVNAAASMSPSLARWFIKDTLPPHLIAAAHTTHCHTFVVAIERRELP